MTWEDKRERKTMLDFIPSKRYFKALLALALLLPVCATTAAADESENPSNSSLQDLIPIPVYSEKMLGIIKPPNPKPPPPQRALQQPKVFLSLCASEPVYEVEYYLGCAVKIEGNLFFFHSGEVGLSECKNFCETHYPE